MSLANCDEDVTRIKKKLEKMMKSNEINTTTSIDMLNVLKNSPINLQILQTTRIGVVVNNLRKSSNSEELGTLAKNLLKSWKKLVSNETNNSSNHNPLSPTSNFDMDVVNNENNNSNSNKPMSPPIIHTLTSSNSVATPSSASSSSSSLTGFSFSSNSKELSKQNSIEVPINKPLSNENHRKIFSSSSIPPPSSKITFTETKDPVRVKSRELLAAALQLPESIDFGVQLADPNAVAARCEDVIFAEFNNTDHKYKNRIRSRIANLKDPKNPKLRENVLLALYSPDRLAVMTAEEMASEDLKQLREKYTKEAIDDHQIAVQQGSNSGLLKCSKCKGTNCGYHEMQTRSADEPMTVFAYCLQCGHRWRFG